MAKTENIYDDDGVVLEGVMMVRIKRSVYVFFPLKFNTELVRETESVCFFL